MTIGFLFFVKVLVGSFILAAENTMKNNHCPPCIRILTGPKCREVLLVVTYFVVQTQNSFHFNLLQNLKVSFESTIFGCRYGIFKISEFFACCGNLIDQKCRKMSLLSTYFDGRERRCGSRKIITGKNRKTWCCYFDKLELERPK